MTSLYTDSNVPQIFTAWKIYFQNFSKFRATFLLEFGQSDKITNLVRDNSENLDNLIKEINSFSDKDIKEILNELEGDSFSLHFCIFPREAKKIAMDYLVSEEKHFSTKSYRSIKDEFAETPTDFFINSLIGYVIRNRKNCEPELRELTEELINWDRINIRVNFDKDSIKKQRELFKIVTRNSGYDPSFWATREAEISYQLEWQELEHGLGDWKSHAIRYSNLFPPFIDMETEIPPKIKNLYAETRRSYVFGQFKSSVALSRAVIEVALKEKGNLNINDTHWTAGKTLIKFLEMKVINKITYDTADDIVVRAGVILHRGADITEEECLYFLDKTRDFIEAFYS